jgi:hypothetical protein
MTISKSDFIMWRECPHNTWVKKNRWDIYNKFEISEFEKSLGEIGNEVELVARKMFPDGYLIEKRSEGAQELTQKLLAEKTPTIFQAVFANEKFMAASDVLKWNEEKGAYDIYEIKMSSASSGDEEGGGGAKEDQFENDLAFQANAALMFGLKIAGKYLIRLNKDYVRKGELDLTPGQLFIIEDKTEVINDLMPGVLVDMERAYDFLNQKAQPKSPCGCYYMGRGSHCTAFTYLNPEVPKYSVHDLNRIGNSKNALKSLLDEGILTIDKVPDEDERLKPSKIKKPGEEAREGVPRKWNQVRVHKTGEPIIDMEAIRRELSSLTFPLYFLDYETWPRAIPPYSGYKPYQQIVFQYSLHILESPEAEPIHKEFLYFDGDPSEQIVAALRRDIDNVGTVISWHKSFENSRNKELAEAVPLEYNFLHDIVKRTYDLKDIVENQHYVHPGFMGRSSIKKVLPALVPELSYKNLGVKNGMEAIESYRQIMEGELTGEAAEKKKKEMLEYCKLDTYAMYRLWKVFYDMINK